MNERSERFLRNGLLLAALLIGQTASAQPVGKWIATGNGDWGNAQNWDIQPMIPNGPTAEAQFLDSITGDTVVTINTPIQVNKLLFNNTKRHRYDLNLADGQSFSFAGMSNEVNIPQSNTGSQRINAPFEISNSDLTITNNSTVRLSIKGGITEAGGARKLTLRGGGPFFLGDTPNNHSGGTDIIASTVDIGDNRSLGSVRAAVGLSGSGTLSVEFPSDGFSLATRKIRLSDGGGTIRTTGDLILESEISGEGNLQFLDAGGGSPGGVRVVIRAGGGEGNTFTGNVTLTSGRIHLSIDSDKALGNEANRLILKGRRMVKLTAENNITSTRPIEFENNRDSGDPTGSHPFVVDTGGFTVKLGGPITGGGTRLPGMQKIGTGKLILSESSSSAFPGKMQVDRGVLQVDGLLSPAEGVFVNGELKGSGTITGQTFVAKEAKAGPAKSPGTLHSIGDVTMEGGSIFDFEVNAATGLAGGTLGWDLWDVDGLLDLNQNLADRIAVRLHSLMSTDEPGLLADFDPTQSHVWPFFATTQGVSGFSPDRFAINTKHFVNGRDGGRFYVRQIDNNVALVFTPAPEPSSLILLAWALVGMATSSRRYGRR